jgi:hypothetical protein
LPESFGIAKTTGPVSIIYFADHLKWLGDMIMKPAFTLGCIGLILCVLTGLSCQREYSCENCQGQNRPPVANAGPDAIVNLPKDSILLNGSASTDPDGTIQKWEWKKIAGPNSFQIVNGASAKTIAKNLNTGVYQFELTVTDNAGATGKDTVAITVTPAAVTNRPPVAQAGVDQVITLPISSASLDGSASYDPDNNIVAYSWTKLSGPTCNIVSTNTVQTKVDNLLEGIYRFQLKVTDAGGLYSMDTILVSMVTHPSEICFNDRPIINAQLVPFGTLSGNRSNLSLATAADKIVFAGGFVQNSGVVDDRTIDLYDLSTHGWSLSIQTPHLNAGVAVSGNKIFLAGGGYYYSDYYSDIDIYDAQNNIWANISFSEAKTLVAGAAISNKIMFAGGFKKSGDYFPNNFENLVEIYEPSTNTWTSVPLSEARGGITSAVIDNKVYFAGGWNTAPSAKIDIYDAATITWSTSTLKFLKTAITAIASGNKIYWTDGSCKVEILNVQTGASSLESLSRPGEIKSVVKDNKIVFVRFGSRYFDIYDPAINRWSVGILPEQIPPGAAVICVNNVIYIAGGVIGQVPIAVGYSPVLTNQVWRLEF